MSDDIPDLDDEPAFQVWSRKQAEARARDHYKLVQGDRPDWTALPEVVQNRWIDRSCDWPGARPLSLVAAADEIDLAINRNLRTLLIADGHAPRSWMTTIHWFDGTVTQEETVRETCSHVCPACLDNRAREEEAFMNEGAAPGWESQMRAWGDVGNGSLERRVGDLEERVGSLETRITKA